MPPESETINNIKEYWSQRETITTIGGEIPSDRGVEWRMSEDTQEKKKKI